MAEPRLLKTLLGAPGTVLVDGAELRVWQPDPDHAPQAYYLRRAQALEDFRALAAQLGLRLRAAPATPDAIWQLPAGLVWSAWQERPQPGAWQAQGQVGSLGVWLRWQGGQWQAVLLP